MEVIRSPQVLQRLADSERRDGRTLALVPTMGALHEGHLSLVREGRRRADRVWVSIFVNPAQFNDAGDFEGYPRDLDADLDQCRSEGVDIVFLPSASDLYPEGHQTWIEVAELASSLCGASRPGHFRGVATVVAKLLLAAKPHSAIFGAKDFQQVAVIRRMARDLGFDVDIVAAPTLREPDGLAMSSRNRRLGPEARRQARVLMRALDFAEHAVAGGECSRDALMAGVRREIAKASQAEIDYAELRDPESLEPAPPVLEGQTLLAVACVFHPDPDGRGSSVRLIDNRVLQPRTSETPNPREGRP